MERPTQEQLVEILDKLSQTQIDLIRRTAAVLHRPFDVEILSFLKARAIGRLIG